MITATQEESFLIKGIPKKEITIWDLVKDRQLTKSPIEENNIQILGLEEKEPTLYSERDDENRFTIKGKEPKKVSLILI